MSSKLYKLAVFLPHIKQETDFTFVSRHTPADEEESSETPASADNPPTDTNMLPYIIPINRAPCPCSRNEIGDLLDLCKIEQPLAADVFKFAGDLAANMSKVDLANDNYNWTLHGAKVHDNNGAAVLVLLGVQKAAPPRTESPQSSDHMTNNGHHSREDTKAQDDLVSLPCDSPHCNRPIPHRHYNPHQPRMVDGTPFPLAEALHLHGLHGAQYAINLRDGNDPRRSQHRHHHHRARSG